MTKMDDKRLKEIEESLIENQCAKMSVVRELIAEIRILQRVIAVLMNELAKPVTK